jgi:hypothetical protein
MAIVTKGEVVPIGEIVPEITGIEMSGRITEVLRGKLTGMLTD